MRKNLLAAFLAAVLAVVLCIPVLAVEASGVRLNVTNTRILVGATRQLTATVPPAEAADTRVTWRSSNESVATVDNTGLITGVKAGEATITATTANGHSTPCQVTVRKEGQEIQASGMEMSVSKMTVRVGQTRLLWVLFTPYDTTERDVQWSSSNWKVASVNHYGDVTGLAPGTATVTATTFSGQTTTCEITVFENSSSVSSASTGSSGTESAGDSLTAAAARAAVREAASGTKSDKVGTATFKDKTSVSQTAINAAIDAAAKVSRDIRLRFTTTNGKNKVLGSMTFDPRQMNTSGSLLTEVLVDSQKIQSAQKRFNKSFKNHIVVIQCTQEGSFGGQAQIAAKADLTDMKTDNLRLYTYDAASNNYTPLNSAKIWIDANGYLRFSTATGGLIIVSDGELITK